MRAIDTNVLVRLLTRDDARQVAAAEAFVESGAWVSHVALAEATWVLTAVYERDRGQIALAIQMLLDHANLALEDSEVVSVCSGTLRTRILGLSAAGSRPKGKSSDLEPLTGAGPYVWCRKAVTLARAGVTAAKYLGK